MEKKYNPADLRLQPEENQRLREKYSNPVFLGGSALFIGLIVTIGSLFLAFSYGGLGIVSYGAILWGGATLWSGLTNVGKYPDRELPVYKAPIVKATNPLKQTISERDAIADTHGVLSAKFFTLLNLNLFVHHHSLLESTMLGRSAIII